MSDYANFLSNLERRNDDIRFASQACRSEYHTTGPILIEKLVALLGTVRRNLRDSRPVRSASVRFEIIKSLFHFGNASHHIK